MPFNPKTGAQIPIEVFGGLDTEMSAIDAPVGLSPDNQDMAFVPGSVFTRPGLAATLDSFGSLGVTYAKTFTAPDQSSTNLYLTSDGVMHVQDIATGEVSGGITPTITPSSIALEDMMDWVIISYPLRTTHHLAYNWLDADGLKWWLIKSPAGHPWDINTYDNNFLYHWITENQDENLWADPHAFKRHLIPRKIMPRFYDPNGGDVVITSPGPVQGTRTTNCEQDGEPLLNLGTIVETTSGPVIMSWGGDVGTKPTIIHTHHYGSQREQYFYVKGLGLVQWEHSNLVGGNWVIDVTSPHHFILPGGCPMPVFPCYIDIPGPGFTGSWIGGVPGAGGNAPAPTRPATPPAPVTFPSSGGIAFTSVFQTLINSYASSITAFGREYIAIHDGSQALDIPRQYDPSLPGADKWRRVTQDGPAGTGLSGADAGTVTVPIVNIVPEAAQSQITSAINLASVVTIQTATSHGLKVGDAALIFGVDVFEYNGQVKVASVPTPTSITYNASASGWNTGTTGTLVPLKVTVTTTVDNGLITGETIVISGNSDPNYNNSTNSAQIVGLVPGGRCYFYSYSHGTGGGFNYNFGGLPALQSTFALAGNQGITFNPSDRGGTLYLPGVPTDTEDVSPMKVYGVSLDATTGFAKWDGTSQTIFGGATQDWCMAVVFNLQFPAAGTYYFRFTHDDGATLGMGGGITPVSGPANDPFNHVHTAKMGYPIMDANNTSLDFAGRTTPFNDAFVVSVPAAGFYPVEIDYVNWETAQICTLEYSSDLGLTYHAILPGAVAFATPPTWTVGNITGLRTFEFTGVYTDATGTGGIITIGGLSSPGNHRLCVSFWTDTDFITKPCPPVNFVSAGAKRITVSGLPIGPPNVKARIVHFTGSGGGNFFYIPVPAVDPASGQTVSTSTVVNDNTSTTATFDFADNTLFASIAVDITGNNLFAMVTLGPCAGVFSYSNRIFTWGDTNKINNLLNMGFEGGTATVGGTLPLGWDTSSNLGGSLIPLGNYFGWQITGNGLISPQGLLVQPAYQDDVHIPILAPNTQYTFKCLAWAAQPNMNGAIFAALVSGVTVLAFASIPANTLGVGEANKSFVQANFDVKTPAVIPSDTVLRIYGGSLNNGQAVVIDEMMMVFTEQPIVPGQCRVSYALNPEAFDGVTGIYATEYPEAVMSQRIIRDNLYTLGAGHLTRTTDNGAGEPITWSNYTVSDIIGGLSLRSFDVAEGWGVFAAESGLYAFSGGEPEKISQEIQSLWSSISPALKQHVWIKNDPINRRIYLGVPLTNYSPTGTTFVPTSVNKLLVLDYRNLNTAAAIQGSGPVRLGFSGKLIATDFARKWTVWNLPMNCGEILDQPGGQATQICFGSGNGSGLSGGFGNVYRLVDGKCNDDDYGLIGALNGDSTRPHVAYYVTYFSPSHDQEQQLQLGSQRKVYTYLEGYVSGEGNLYVVPLMDRLGNPTSRPPRARLLSAQPNFDLEWPLNITTQRMALLFYALPG